MAGPKEMRMPRFQCEYSTRSGAAGRGAYPLVAVCLCSQLDHLRRVLFLPEETEHRAPAAAGDRRGSPTWTSRTSFSATACLYAVGQFTCGPLADRYGARRIVGAGLLVIVASNLMMCLRGSPLWLLVFACLNGLGQSSGWSGWSR